MNEKNLLAVLFTAAFLVLAGCEGGQDTQDDQAAQDQAAGEDTQMAEDTTAQESDATDTRMAGEDATGDTGMGQDALGMGGEGEHTVAGTVTAIDEQAQEVTLDHEPVESLNLPAMVMPFQVSDASLLEEVEVGERVTATLADLGNGEYVIQDLEPAAGGQ